MGRQGVSDAIIRHRKLDQKIIMAKEIALTAEVARFVTRTQPASIPRKVMHLGKRSLLDGLGLALAGNAAESGHIVRNYLKTLGVPLECGATVIGTVGSDEKVALAKKVGCKHVVVMSREKLSERVKAITKGKGVPVVYDGVGKDTFMESLDCLQPRGIMASFGNASGAVPPVNIGILAQKGSLFLTRPTLVNYTSSREDLLTAARELFAVVKKGAVKIAVNQRYPLREAAQAHRDLESRKTTGSTVLLP